MDEEQQKVEDIEIPLLPMQKAFLRSDAKFLAVVSSRAQGKTFVAVLQALLCLLDGQNVVYGVQNLDAWRKGGEQHLKKFLKQFDIEARWRFNKSTYTGYLKTEWGEAALYIFTYESEDSIRGATEISMAVLDEFVLSSPRIMASLTPVLRGHDLKGNVIRPRIRAVSTPNMNSEWQLMLIEHDKHGIELLRANPNDNIYVTEEQRALMAASIFDEKLRRQECLGEIILGDNSTSMLSLNDFSDQPKYSTSRDMVWAGLDMAHTGDRDRHVFCAVLGDKELVALHDFGVCDSIDVAAWIKKFNSVYRIQSLWMDLAWSESVYDQLKYEIPCSQIPFGSAAEEKETYANKRAEMYFRGARIIRDDGLFVYTWTKNPFVDEKLVAELKREMSNIHWLQNTSNKLQIEPKTDVRIRIGKSPDVSDAFVLAATQVPRDMPQIKSKLNPQEDPLLKEALAEIMEED
jgi:hypothetical protein